MTSFKYSIKLDRKSAKYLFPTVFCLILVTFFSLIFVLRINTDLQLHIKLLNNFKDIGEFPYPFLYYNFIEFFSKFFFFLNSNIALKISSVIVLTIACMLKYDFCYNYFKETINEYNEFNPQFKQGLIFILMFFFPIICFSLDESKWYLGKFTPTIWHNSTSIFAFPIGFLLFTTTIKNIDNISLKNFLNICILMIVLAISKPSYLFGFIPGIGLSYLFIKGLKINVNLFKIMFIVVLGLLIIFFTKYLVYEYSKLDQVFYQSSKSKIVIAPFKVWFTWVNHPIISILSSFSIFIIAFFHWGKKLIKEPDIILSCFVLLCALLIFFLFAESGPRFTHMNLYWQIPISFFCLLCAVTKHLYQRLYLENCKDFLKKSFKEKLLISSYLIHFASGIFYVFKILLLKNYQ